MYINNHVFCVEWRPQKRVYSRLISCLTSVVYVTCLKGKSKYKEVNRMRFLPLWESLPPPVPPPSPPLFTVRLLTSIFHIHQRSVFTPLLTSSSILIKENVISLDGADQLTGVSGAAAVDQVTVGGVTQSHSVTFLLPTCVHGLCSHTCVAHM